MKAAFIRNYLNYYSLSDTMSKFLACGSLQCQEVRLDFSLENISDLSVRNKLYFILYSLNSYIPKIQYRVVPSVKKQVSYTLKLSLFIKNPVLIQAYLVSFFLEAWSAVFENSPTGTFRVNTTNTQVSLGVSSKSYFSAFSELALNLRREYLFVTFKFNSSCGDFPVNLSPVVSSSMFWFLVGAGTELFKKRLNYDNHL